MVVCLCQKVTDHQLKESIKSGTHTVRGLRHELGIGRYCSCCVATVQKYIEEYSDQNCCNTPSR